MPRGTIREQVGIGAPEPAIEGALRHLALGRAIIPVWSPDLSKPKNEAGLHPCMCPRGANCKSPGKHPAVYDKNDGQGFLSSALKDEDQIRRVLSNPGTRNYGVIPAVGEVFLDLDGEGLATWQKLNEELGKAPPTDSQRTKNGWHVAYLVDNDPMGNLFGIVTRRRPGGYIVGEGSTHPTGTPYAHYGPTQVAKLPLNYVERAREAREYEKANPVEVHEVAPGQRHDYLRDKARYLHGIGMTDDEVFATLMGINATFSEPKSPEEVRQAMGDLSRFPVDPPPIVLDIPEAGSQAPSAAGARAKSFVYTPGCLGSETFNDLPTDDPPPMLLDGWLHPEETTILYGKGGVGKGLTAAWLALRLVQEEEKRVYVLDYENHRREWGKRVTDMGATPDEKDMMFYRAPFGKEWRGPKGPIIQVIDPIIEDVLATAADYVIIDSYSAATTTHDSLGGQESAIELATALQMIGLPVLLLAHVAATETKYPDKPFGSVHVHNLVARRTWAVARESEEASYVDNGVFMPHIVRLSYRCQKSNDGPRPADKVVTFSIYDVGRSIEAVEEAAVASMTAEDIAYEVLTLVGKPMTTKQIVTKAADLYEGVKYGTDSYKKAMARKPSRFKSDSSNINATTWEAIP